MISLIVMNCCFFQEWSWFAYDTRKYMEFVLKEISVIRLSSDIEIKKRQFGNINSLMKHLTTDYNSKKSQFFKLLNNINSLATVPFSNKYFFPFVRFVNNIFHHPLVS